MAVVVLDDDAVKAWRAEPRTFDSTQKDSNVTLEEAVLDQMMETGRRLGLKGYELVYAGKYGPYL